MAYATSLIKTIYLYVFSGVGLALILIGAYNGIRYGVNISQFDKYPLQQWEETPCIGPYSMAYPARPMIEGDKFIEATPSAEEQARQEKNCEDNKEKQRKIKQTQDLTNSIAMLVLGTLVFIPHWKLARKSS